MGNEVSSTLPEDWATVDMVNRFTFYPRLFHLMYVEGRWEENQFTLEGKAVHRRVDRIDQLLPVSVFLCSLTAMEVKRLGANASEIIHQEEDQLLVIDIGPDDVDWTTSLSCHGKTWSPTVRSQII